ncbi:decaprenylphospho-beta-D-erythro-pentofuranosid-2-ulose 2-reductase [Luteococcus japonicus]|uniref:Decaprenylphospho-beta-D-erythro-pentofuranosid-2-ulose 2-reductase n=1 Tax=Luteococcus japonicus TaxID=33984 RepID=A0A3N1ZXD9_9ACTN|nr:decaprenylphospho-beta-D-erythro-pentofuranosid-2-ulose 2-reductase [Luteococcus japonicus]ROR55523.1 decaprenylphospho-beta-D-erythro-pentofuranosid-2-ulose 2-reductase [Luteococcus japonicus]
MSAILLLGGRSGIGLAIVEALLSETSGATVLLAQRPRPEAPGSDAEERLRAAGAAEVEVVDFDATALETHATLVEGVFAEHQVSHAVVAFGVLGNQEEAWTEVAAAQRLLTVNSTAAVGIGVALANAMRRQASGKIIALSSVAGVRVRRSNFVYGASKAAMDAFYLNLGVALEGTGVRVLVVRPGAVATGMIAGNKPVAFTVEAPQVAETTMRGLAAGKDVVHVPSLFGPGMALAALLPRALWRRLPV